MTAPKTINRILNGAFQNRTRHTTARTMRAKAITPNGLCAAARMISGAFSRNPSTDFHMIFLAHLVSKQGKGSALESRNWLSLFSRLIQYPAAPPFFSFLATCFIQFYTLPREGQQDFFQPCHGDGVFASHKIVNQLADLVRGLSGEIV